jgi:hypothetical protein
MVILWVRQGNGAGSIHRGSISTVVCCCNFAAPRSPPMPGCWLYRELDDTLGLTDTGADELADARTGKNGRHRLAGLLRQSVFGRLAGYEDVNDAERLCRDPAICPASGSTRCSTGNRPGSLCSTWIRARAQPTASRKAAPHGVSFGWTIEI